MATTASQTRSTESTDGPRRQRFTVIENTPGERFYIDAPPSYTDESKIALTDNSRKVLERRYLRRDLDGSLLETPAGMFYRVAYHVAQVEKQHEDDPHADVEGATQTFYELMSQFRFFPNSPTFTGAGTPLGQLAACFVLPIDDDMGKADDGIFSTLRVAALIQQTGGGNGFSFSRLRPKNDLVHTSAGRATGPVGFLRVYDQAFGEIAQGGSRRGANMGVLRVDHPDIEEFIECKATEGSIANFNISVAITDEFMQAVKEDTDFSLRNPRNGQVWKTVRARDLFAKIIKYAHHNGEPGALFIDAANRSNPVPHLYDLEATNPCVTGDTLIYTGAGVQRASDLWASGATPGVVIDSRFGEEATVAPASPVYQTGEKPVFRLRTQEGHELKATGDHRVMTTTGWLALQELRPGMKVHVLNRKGGFGSAGNLTLGRTTGWLFGDGSFNIAEGAGLMFFGDEQELAPLFAGYVNDIVGTGNHRNTHAPTREYVVGVSPVMDRSESRVVSTRLKETLRAMGIADKERVPEIVFLGSEEMQRGFLQGLFSADGTVLDNVEKGVSVRLWSANGELLQDVQRLLLNFGIASRIYFERKRAGYKHMPDGRGGERAYYTQAGHELVVSKQNLVGFHDEINFLQPAKAEKLARALDAYGKRGPYAEHFTATVKDVEPLGVQLVYDLTEPLTHSFVANGIVVHNCGEQWLGPYENCCLGSINLGVHVTTDVSGKAQVDWDLLRRSVRESTHFLDNVVTANAYVPVVPRVAEAAYRARRIGLGIMGLGDMMYKLGIRYGSEEGQEFAAQIMAFVRYHSMKRSVELSEQRGPFLAFEGSIYDAKQPGGMKWQPPQPPFPFMRDWGMEELDWSSVVQGIEQHGIRNAAQTTVAPTGTIATVCGCEGYGCEPVFALGYVRHFKDGDKDVELVYTSPLFEQALDATSLSETRKNEIKQHVATYGSCQDIDDLPEHLRHTFVVSGDISAEEHVRMQAAIQAYVDNSISKCVVGDTLVLTEEGLVPIEELSAMRLPDQFSDLRRNIISPSGVETAQQFYYGGYRETRKLTLSYGFNIEATPNHRIHVLAPDGSIQFRRLDELTLDDTVVLYGNQQRFGRAGSELPGYSGTYATNSKQVVFPSHMSEEFAFMLGCITSEGAITRNGVSIANNDRELLGELQTIVQQVFGLQSTIIADKRNNVHSLQINSRPLRHWLLVDLGMEAGAENKILPTCILQAGKSEIAAFLRGLLLDGFMTLDGKLAGLTLASERLIRQLQTLLLNMGVVATTRQVTDRAWNLTVQGGELEALALQISFVEVWKNERISRRNEGRTQRFRNYSRLMPVQLTTALREMQQASGRSLRSLYITPEGNEEQAYQRTRVNLTQGHRLERGDADRVYRHLNQDSQHPYAATFFGHDGDDRLYVRVEAMEKGFAEVFDINVPGSHTFIANGLGNHNTCNFPETATEEDVANAYMLAWELGCKGLTVYVTGSRQQVVLETKATKETKGKSGSAAEETSATAQAAETPYVNGTSNGAAHNSAQGSVASGGESRGDAKRSQAVKRPRPALLKGSTYRKETPLGSAYITVNSDERGEPFEVFLNVGKAGSDVSAVSEAIGRLVSLVLRMPGTLPPTERLRWVMDEMAGIGGGRPLGFGAKRVRSLPDGIAQVLAEHLSELPEAGEDLPAEQLALPIAQRPIGDICPECGEAAFLNVEGCRKCHVCGYSEC